MRTESPAYLRSVYKALWRGSGAGDEEAEIYAQCFVHAELLVSSATPESGTLRRSSAGRGVGKHHPNRWQGGVDLDGLRP